MDYMYLLLDSIRTNNLYHIAMLVNVSELDINDNSFYELYYGTPLHFAVSQGCFRTTIQFLCGIGSDVNAIDYYGDTPLHYALEYKNIDIIMGLLSIGSSPDVYKKNMLDETPLDLARDAGREMYDLLIPYTKGHRLWVKWRPIVRVLGRLVIQYRESVDNVWKPGGVGFYQCKLNFEKKLY